MLEEFREYIKQQGIEGSGVHKHFKNLRVFLNWVDAENDDVEIPSCYKKLKVSNGFRPDTEENTVIKKRRRCRK